jgi:hypothetical protein
VERVSAYFRIGTGFGKREMGYTLQAVIGKMKQLATAMPPGTRLVQLPQGMGLIPVSTDAQSLYGVPFLPFTDEGETAMPPGLDGLVQPLLGTGKVAYVEAEFFGGDGTQARVIWDESGQRSDVLVHPYAINQALWILGVECGEDTDEFDAIDLGRYRYTDEWEADATAEPASPADG